MTTLKGTDPKLVSGGASTRRSIVTGKQIGRAHV